MKNQAPESPKKSINDYKIVYSVGSHQGQLSTNLVPDPEISWGAIRDAIEDWHGLTSITIPASVTSIGDRAFACCKNLKNIIILSYIIV